MFALLLYTFLAVITAVVLYGQQLKEPPVVLRQQQPKTRAVSSETATRVFKAFKSYVETRDDQKSLFYDNLKGSILKQIMKGCSYKVFSLRDFEGKYLIFLNGKSDSVLMEWAKLCFFPRGLPLLFDFYQNQVISNSGFLPKFDNDHHGHDRTKNIFKDVYKMRITKKFSGHLTGVVLYMSDEGIPTFAVVSKKSADPETKFVSEPYRLWDSMLTPDKIEYLLKKGITTLWGECLGKYDQAHGSAVKEESIVLTSAGMTSEFSSNNSPKSITNDDLFDLLNEVGLDRYMVKPYIFTNSETIMKFGDELSENRDVMTNTLFNQILRKYDVDENDQHGRFLGNRLEGVIINLFTSEGSKTVKYKFTPYVVLTMFLREASNAGKTKMGVIENGQWKPSYDTVYAIEKFVSRWVFDPANNDYYRGYCLRLSEIQDSMDDTDDPVAKWIRADQQISTETVKPVSKEELELSILSSSRNVICVVAPVGYGKSTFANALCQYLNKIYGTDKFVHVDCDECGFIANLPDDPRKLGQERNNVFHAIILKLLSEGKIPIVSNGGGIFKEGGPRSKFIFDNLTKTLGVYVRPIFFTPHLDSFSDENLREMVKNAVEFRKTKGYYEHEHDIENVLYKVSKRNLPFMQNIKETYDTCHFDPVKNGKSKIPDPLPDLSNNSSEALPLKVNQLRHLVEIDGKCYHETLYYDYNILKDFKYNPSEQPFTSQLPLYEVKELKGKKEKVVLALVLTENGHITVSSGSFLAKSMRDVEKFLRDTSQNELVLKEKNESRTFNRSEFKITTVPVTFLCKFGF